MENASNVCVSAVMMMRRSIERGNVFHAIYGNVLYVESASNKLIYDLRSMWLLKFT